MGIALYQVQPSGEISVHWSTPEFQSAVGGGSFAAHYGGAWEGMHAVSHALNKGLGWQIKSHRIV